MGAILNGDEPELPETDDLRSSLESLYDAPIGGEVVSGDKADAALESAIPENETTEQREARIRDEKGRFAKADEVPDAKAAPAKPESPSVDNQAKASAAPAPTPADAPPVGWTADAKAEWSKLSPALKAAVLKREDEIAKGGQQWSAEKRRYEEMVHPVRVAASRRGINEQEGIQRLLAADAYLERDPEGAIRWLAQAYGVNLQSNAGQQPAEDSTQQQQPDIRELVRQAVAPILNPIQQRFMVEDQRLTQSIVEQFASSHEHFEAVTDGIMEILPGIKAAYPHWTPQQVLQKAYDVAVYGNEEMRNSILGAKEREAEQARIADAKKKAAQSRLAASSVTGSSGGQQAEAPKDSLRAEIEAAFAG